MRGAHRLHLTLDLAARIRKSMHLETMDIVLALLTFVPQLSLAFLLIKRLYWRRFPVFFAYICYAAASEVAIVAVRQLYSRRTYFVFYWAVQAVYTLLGLASMDESFRKHLRPYFTSTFRLRLQLLFVVTFVFVIVGWLWLKSTPIQASPVMAAFICFTLAANYMRAAVYGLFVVTVMYWRAKWSPHTFGIMQGFGLFSIVGALAGLLRSVFGINANLFFSLAPSVAYICACFIWLVTFSVREPPPRAAKAPVDSDELFDILSRLTRLLK